MRTPNVAHTSAYQRDERAPTTHTLTINDERDQCGSVTIWAYPQGLPQSVGMAVTANVDSPLGIANGMPTATIHACHREALKVHLSEGKLVIDTQGMSLALNETTGLYELAL
ncbi:hypothetical protein GIW05_03080 [Pseudomonas syringae]|uniref:hypothetical protein n=1 Tax=Pseudomonas syringae TaxID=317 RepID=UPI001F3ACDBD|nr:hypothetical protein [Pseudomonas syringae]MCF5382489.1 hypothetical protein [Pseudomonas syringae]MCF5419376.1 hypothetical protein [Pseudomonas syringae]MCF5451923.1 hypothetical protein [Pseudomonas syringae]MCF5460272.1 hypothetical protein [Pseudomonas syringae]